MWNALGVFLCGFPFIFPLGIGVCRDKIVTALGY